MCQRGDHLATLKSKKYKSIAFIKTLQRLKQEWQKSPALGLIKRQKLGFVWKNRKKIGQIINVYLYLPFFLLIILWEDLFPARAVVLWGGGGGGLCVYMREINKIKCNFYNFKF